MVNRRPNILIITFDCLRPDHLNGLGYHGTRTPTFDRYMAEGVTFTNAYCQAPNTWMSHASLFSGCNPYLHGARTPLRKLSGRLQLMAEAFKDAGYQTFGLPAMSLLSRAAGFSRGFDQYRLDGLQSGPGALAHRYYRSAGDTLALTLEWLRTTRTPFFGWVHYFGTHKVEPNLLDLPAQFRRRYSPYAQFYDGKISFADAEFLAPLTGHMAQLGLLDDTIMVLWSDHGENLHALEHNLYWGHNWGLDETVMRTLLIMRGPGLPHGEERAQIAQSIDIFPTLLDLARLPPLPQCEGQSLLKLPLPPAPVVYMENLTQGFVGLRQGAFKLVLAESGTAANKLDRGWAAQKFERAKKRIKRFLPRRWAAAVRQTDALAAWWQAQGEPEDVLQRLLAHGERRLYNLSADPDERQNLAPGHPQEMQALVSLLRQQAGRTVTGQLAALNAEEAAQIEAHLKALGYL